MKLFLSPTIHKIRPFPLPTLPFSSIRQQNGTESYLSAVDEWCTPLFQCSIQCLIAHHSIAVCATFKESSATFKREQWCILLPLMQRSACR